MHPVRVEAQDYRILVLPSGGATGIISATVLNHLEKQSGKRIYELFDEVWGSSIGSMIGSMLLLPKPGSSDPWSASEVVDFLEEVFSKFYSASRIRTRFKQKIAGDNVIPAFCMKDTLRPLRIVVAEVHGWNPWFQMIPQGTSLRSFSTETDPSVSLASVVCGSCSVSPVHRAERVEVAEGEVLFCIDAGCLVSDEPCMNPVVHLMNQFLEKIDPEKDTVSLFFMSNGWVRLGGNLFQMQGTVQFFGKQDQKIEGNLYNLDTTLDSVFGEWQATCRTGQGFRKVSNYFGGDLLLYNLAGAGCVPTDLFKQKAEEIIQTPVFTEILERLLESS